MRHTCWMKRAKRRSNSFYGGITEDNNCEQERDHQQQFAEMRPEHNIYWKILAWFTHLSVQHTFFSQRLGVGELNRMLRTIAKSNPAVFQTFTDVWRSKQHSDTHTCCSSDALCCEKCPKTFTGHRGHPVPEFIDKLSDSCSGCCSAPYVCDVIYMCRQTGIQATCSSTDVRLKLHGSDLAHKWIQLQAIT